LDYSPGMRLPHTEVCFTERWGSHRFRSAGKLFVVPPGETLRIRADPGETSTTICGLSSEKISKILGEEFEFVERHFEESADFVDVCVRNLLFQLGSEVQRPGFASDVMIEGIVAQIAVLLSRQYVDIQAQHNRGGLSPWRLRRIDSILEEGGSIPSLS